MPKNTLPIYTIRFVQRTATGLDGSGRTVIWCVPSQEPFAWGTGAVDWIVGGRKPADALAKIIIVHPALMAGSPDEIHSEFIRAARRKLRDDRMISVNDYGVEFWEGTGVG